MNAPRRIAATLAAAALALVGAEVGAQASTLEPCETVLAEAERRYLEQDYASVEPYVVECVYRPGVTAHQLQQAYRLLALSFIKQDLLAEAQITIVKLFGVDYAYEADPVQDPPLYVALVSAVKDQLRVEGDAVADAEPNPAPVAAAEAPRLEDSGPVPLEVRQVNVNTATAEELEALTGIGPALAQRIVEYRSSVGPFARPEDLQYVRGIGPNTAAALAPYVTIGDGVAVVAAPAPAAALGMEGLEADRSGAPLPLVNLNTATAEELDTLPGIGPALAQRIIESRAQEGPFRTVEDVLRVRGIGPVKLSGFVDRVTVE